MRRGVLVWVWLLPLMTLSALSGCATPQEEAPEVLITGVEGQATEGQATAQAEAVPRVRPGTAGPLKPQPPLALNTIVGLDEARTIELLGQPQQVRVEAPATIWSYSRAECRLEIYFYPSLRERRLQSLTYEIAGAEDQAKCLNEFGMTGNGSS